MEALDTNGDGTLSTDEIANASESLKKLDKNGDGYLDEGELGGRFWVCDLDGDLLVGICLERRNKPRCI